MAGTTTHGPAPEGLECLVTMEDITIEDGNYGMFCLVACDAFVYDGIAHSASCGS